MSKVLNFMLLNSLLICGACDNYDKAKLAYERKQEEHGYTLTKDKISVEKKTVYPWEVNPTVRDQREKMNRKATERAGKEYDHHEDYVPRKSVNLEVSI